MQSEIGCFSCYLALKLECSFTIVPKIIPTSPNASSYGDTKGRYCGNKAFFFFGDTFQSVGSLMQYATLPYKYLKENSTTAQHGMCTLIDMHT